jgi:hypothetical protein
MYPDCQHLQSIPQIIIAQNHTYDTLFREEKSSVRQKQAILGIFESDVFPEW